jgi:hypothetical protein
LGGGGVVLLNTKLAATATSSRSTDQTKIPATPEEKLPPWMGFPSPPSFESDVHPEHLLFMEFHAEKRTLGIEKALIRWMGKMGRWMGSEKHRKEPAVEKEEDRLSDELFRVCARADAAEIRAFWPFSAPTTAILLSLWSS